MLKELVEEYKKSNDSWQMGIILRRKTNAEKLQLAQEYNKEKNPSIEASCLISQLDIGYVDTRVFNDVEAKEIMRAYHKCAQNLSQTIKKEKDEEKLEEIDEALENLRNTTHRFMYSHKETAGSVLDIYCEYMTDRGSYVIDSIGACMMRNPRIWDKGFQAIHKIVDIETRKAKLKHQENWNLICSQQLQIVMRGLFEAAKTDKMTEKFIKEYISFEENIDKAWVQDTIEEVPGAHISLRGSGQSEKFDTYTALLKTIFKRSVKQIEANQYAKTYGRDSAVNHYEKIDEDYDRNFSAIFKEIAEYYKEEMVRLKAEGQKKQKKVKKPRKVKRNNVSYATEFDVDLMYAGEKRPTVEDTVKIVPYSPFESRGMGNPSKPQSGGLWTSPMEENGKSQWQNWIEKEMPETKQKFEQSWHIVPTEDCRILIIDKFDKIKPYLKYDETIDFMKLSKDYDLLYLPYEIGSWNKTFYNWDVKTGYFMNAQTKDGKPLFQVFDNEEYKRYKIEKNKKKVASLKGKDVLTVKKAGDVAHNKALMKVLKEAQAK